MKQRERERESGKFILLQHSLVLSILTHLSNFVLICY